MYSPIAIVSPSVSDGVATRPVYVYGKSGKCWRFRDESRIRPYFSSLLRTPGVFEACEELVRRYGPSIADRLNIAFREDRMESVAIDPEVEYTDDNGMLRQVGSRAYTFIFKKANIEITSLIPYEEKASILAELLDGFYTRITIAEQAVMSIYESRDVWDYLTGDRIVHDEPRAPPSQAPWYSWLLPGPKVNYPVIDVDVSAKRIPK